VVFRSAWRVRMRVPMYIEREFSLLCAGTCLCVREKVSHTGERALIRIRDTPSNFFT